MGNAGIPQEVINARRSADEGILAIEMVPVKVCKLLRAHVQRKVD